MGRRGLASYLLIGFWYKKPSANRPIKAFVVNRVGDFGFLLGLFGVFVLFGSVNFGTIFANAASFIPADAHGAEGAAGEAAQHGETVLTFLGYHLDKAGALTVVCLLLFMGAMGKSAQVPLHTWLPDAMEGPTPVSALIHAATMVTAGVFMLARLSPLFELSHRADRGHLHRRASPPSSRRPSASCRTTSSASSPLRPARSSATCSSRSASASIRRRSSTSSRTPSSRRCSSSAPARSSMPFPTSRTCARWAVVRKLIPKTYWMMVIGTLALTGVGIPLTVIGTAGFFLQGRHHRGRLRPHSPVAFYAFWALVIAAVHQLLFLAADLHDLPWRAAGQPLEVMHHVHESPPVMMVPLFIPPLARFCTGFAFKDYFIGENYEAFWQAALFTLPDNHILHDFHGVPLWVKVAPFAAMIIGFLVAWQFYIRSPETPKRLAAQHRGLYAFLLNKWYFDELYDFLFVRPAKRLGRFLWKTGDGTIIDGLGPDGVSARVVDVTNRVVKLQTGYLYHYAFAMLIGVAALVTWMMFGSH